MNKSKEENDLDLEEEEGSKNEDSDEELEDDLEVEDEEDDDLEDDLDDLEEDDLEAEADAEDDEENKKEKPKSKNNKINYETEAIDDFSENDFEDEEDSDLEEDDNVLQKFNENLNTKFLEDIHMETKSINYDEMIALSRIVRDKTGKIIDPLHTTLPFLTKYEKARVIGARAEQLDRGGEAFIPLDESIINGRTIALMEFEAKKIPFILARPLPNGSVEYWHLSDLEIL
jgi:DNA-directed RNA polymerase subunit K/omega